MYVDFSRKLTLLGEGEQKKQATLLDYIKPFGESNSKSNIDAYSARKNFEYDKCGFVGDAKPPQRLLNTPSPKRGQELADDIAERIHKTTLKRDQLINDIVERCRLYVS